MTPEKKPAFRSQNTEYAAFEQGTHAKTLHSLVEAQAIQSLDAVAVAFEEHHLTYAALEARANQLAWYLRTLGVGLGTLVGIFAERSLEMVVALYATLKTGGAYVPIDPTYPAERVTFMLHDAQVPVLLTQAHLRPRIPPYPGQIVSLETDWPRIGQLPSSALPSPGIDEDLAYMIYTSGSTGQPKGTMNTHRGICNRLLWMQNAYGLQPEDRVLQKTPFSFDVSVWEFFWPLFTGARLTLAIPDGHRDSTYLRDIIQREGITTLHFVPSMLHSFLHEPEVEACGSILRRVFSSGEALSGALQARFFARLPTVELHNLYGPTEAAVDVTAWACQPEDPGATVPIGRPITNIQIHILDSDDQLVPIGVSGELHIAGVGLARGYHLQPALTAEKFIPYPMGLGAGARIYKTGDLARYRSDGAIEYLGRLDHQVKIRGFRIECGEIESTLTTHPNIREAVVVPWRDQSQAQRLVAYLVSTTTDAPTTTELVAWLKRTLPDYMLPARFIIMNALPLTPSGKIDRKALPSPDTQRPHLENIFVPPTTPLEAELASIWSQVLELTPVGIHDSFFELGGDSIRAIQVLAQAQQQGIRFTLQQLFMGQTIHSLMREIDRNQTPVHQGETLVVPFGLVTAEDRRRLPAGLEDAYPLTSLQMGMFYHNETNPTSAIFHDIFTFRIQYPFHHERLQLAVDHFVERHAPMRTSFDLGSFTEPLQLVHPSARLLLAVEDLQHLDSAAQTKTLEAWIADEKRRPFDPTQAPLLRLLVHRYSAGEFQLIVSFHHVILDGWSLAVMLTEILQDYSALLGGFNSSITAPAIPYRAYVASERAAVAAKDSREFWIEKLHNPDIHLLPRWPESYKTGGTEQMRSSEIPIPGKIFAGLKALALNAKVPIKSVLLAAHHRVMNALHGRPDVISGIITNGRPEEIDGERMVGLFLNTVPMRLRLDGGTWFELVQQVFLAELELIPHRRFPLADIQQALGGNMLFETAFDFVHFHVYRHLDGFKDMGFMEGHYFEANNFVLFPTFMIDIPTEQLQMHIDYDPAELCAEQIEAICAYYVNTLSLMASQPHARYDTFSPLSHQERKQQLLDWNKTTSDYPSEKCLHVMFEEQVKRTPDAVALIDGIHSLSYRHLNQRANRLAHQLIAKGVGPDVLVGLCVDRSLEMVLAMLAILKAGGAYVPLDPAYPKPWLAAVLENTRAPLLLTHTRLWSHLPDLPLEVLYLDKEVQSAEGTPELLNLVTDVTPDHLAYVLYTSGSTGQPKGVAIPHHGPVALIHWAQEQFLPEEVAGVLASTSICFDLSVFEIFVPLISGGTVFLAENALALPTLPAASQVTLINSVPSAMRELLRLHGVPPSVRVVNLAGEPLRTALVQQVYAVPGIRKVYDLYGPTEATTYSTVALRSANGSDTIGRPIANVQIYLVAENQELLPVGVAGEMLIGGAGLARGYYHRPDLTAKQFLPHPFGPHPGARVYRSGDLGRYRPDGMIEYLGRRDHQVKVRGFRIELGEIESTLLQHPTIQNTVVLCREDTPGEKQLVAYVVSQAKEILSPANLRAFLQQKLPEYMIPTALLVLDAIPLTPNGKNDRRALPPPDKAREQLETAFVLPQTLEEEILANIWATTMNIPKVGIYDNFFALGGHSLLATQIISKIRGAFFIDLSIQALFDHPTVADLAQQITEISQVVSQQEPTTISPRTTQKSFPLSYIQERFWILDKLCRGYALSRAFHLKGSVNEQAIQHSFQDMVERHEIFRTTFPFFGGQPQQVIAPTVTLDIPIIALPDLDDKARESEGFRLLQEEEAQPFDLAQGPLLRVKFLRFDSTNYFIIITLHQVICDCLAIEVLFRELSTLYRSYCEGQIPSLPALPLQYADYTLWQHQHLKGPAGAQELAYWQKILEDPPPPLPLSTDYPRGSVQTFRSNQVKAQLSQELTHKIPLLKKQTRSTFFMILLGVINLYLFHVTGKTGFVIGSPVAGRQRPEFEPLIGSFLNNLVLRTKFSKDQTFVQLLAHVREQVLGALAYQEVPFEHLLETFGFEWEPGRTPPFQILLNMDTYSYKELAVSQELKLAGVKTFPVISPNFHVLYDWTVYFQEYPDQINLKLLYNADLFAMSRMQATMNQLRGLLEQVIHDPDRPLQDYFLIQDLSELTNE